MMKIYRIPLILLGLFLLIPAGWSEVLSTPGAGFVFSMEDLAELSDSFGYDTIIKEATDVLDDTYIDYFINDTVEISSTDLLTIVPGERLVFRMPQIGQSLNPQLSVRGRLVASGAAEGDIVFTSLAAYVAKDPAAVTPTLPFSMEDYIVTATAAEQLEDAGMDISLLTNDMMVYQGVQGITVATSGAPGQWDNIGFNNPSGKSVLRFVTIEYADIGVQCRFMTGDRLTVDHCTIHDNYTGIFINRASPKIIENLGISYNRLIYSDTLIKQTGTAIYITGISQPLIRGNVFEANEGNSITIAGTLIGTIPKLGNIYNTEGGVNVGKNQFRIGYATNEKTLAQEPIGQNHIFNETPNTIYAQQNSWDMNDYIRLDGQWLYDDDESPDSGPIIFTPVIPYYRELTGVDSGNWANYR